MYATIAGVGSAVPSRVMTNEELAKIVDTSDEWIRTRTGIQERRIAAPDEATSDFALIAGKRALEMAGWTASDLDFIIVATCTPDTLFPATACIVQSRLDAKKAAAMDLSAACTGFNYALSIGAALIESERAKNVMVIGADCLSKFVDWKDRSTCVLFGDGAGATLLSAGHAPGIMRSYLRSRGEGGPLLCISGGGSRAPLQSSTIFMNGKEVFKFAVEVMVESVQHLLQQAQVSLSDIACLIPHQANLRIIDMAVKRLRLSPEKVYVNLQKYGNTSAASIPLALDEAAREGRIKRGDMVVMVGFGAGLTYGANLLRWSME